MYLFQESPGKWIFGKTKESECGAGKYRVEPSEDRSKITLYSIDNDIPIWKDRDVTSFKKANDQAYANFTELRAAYDGFFQTTQAAVTVTGGLTNTQLRATDVPVSQASQPLPTGAATAAKQSDGSQKAQTVDAASVDDITRYKTKKLTVTLPNNQNTYAAGDVVLGIALTALEWANVAKAAGYGIDIVGARIQVTDPTGLANKTFRLHVFNNTVTPIADNAAFAIADANTDKREGNFLVQLGTGTMSKVGSNYAENIIMNPVGTSVYLILETVEGFTPSAVSTVINIYLKYIQGN